MSSFKDHFSGHASSYASARPHYPATLFAWLAEQCGRRELAWDAGCGNGQAALALAPHFAHVVATDPSAAQIEQATPHAQIEYRVEPAESPSLLDASVDLVTVAQALHWFDLPRFNASAERVLRAGGVIAAWTYGLSSVDVAVDRVFERLYEGLLGPYWPPERRHVESGYVELPFPFEPLAPQPDFAMQCLWTLPQYLAYLRTWSASQRYAKAIGEDAVTQLEASFMQAWGDPQQARIVHWPLGLRAGRKTA